MTSRSSVNGLSLAVIEQELTKLVGAELNDRQREFAVKAYQATLVAEEIIETSELEDIPSEVLEQWMRNHESKTRGDYPNVVDEEGYDISSSSSPD